jgi:hypothetical protein
MVARESEAAIHWNLAKRRQIEGNIQAGEDSNWRPTAQSRGCCFDSRMFAERRCIKGNRVGWRSASTLAGFEGVGDYVGDGESEANVRL